MLADFAHLGFSALEVLFRPGAVSFTFGTWRLEGEACIHGVFMTVLLVAGSYSSLGLRTVFGRLPYSRRVLSVGGVDCTCLQFPLPASTEIWTCDGYTVPDSDACVDSGPGIVAPSLFWA